MTEKANWSKVRKEASENSHWPGQRVYCHCNIRSIRDLCPEGYLEELQREAREHGCWVDYHKHHVCIVVPKPLSKKQKSVMSVLGSLDTGRWVDVGDHSFRRSLKVLEAKGLVETLPSEVRGRVMARLAPFKPLPGNNQVP